MYALIYGFATCLATCEARVLSGNPSSSMMLDHEQPTPFQLAAAQLTTFSPPAHNLTLPINPEDHFRYHLDGYLKNIQRNPPLKGGQLIYVLNCEAYKIWGLTSDAPIRRAERDLIPPFERIQLSLEPTAVAPHSMTLQKLGIALLLLMKRFFVDTRFWPAGFDFDITESVPPSRIGTIRVRQALRGNVENSTAQSLFGDAAKDVTLFTDSINSLSDSINSLSVRIEELSVRIDDRDWLNCISNMFWYAFKHTPTSTLQPQIPPGNTLHFPVVPGLVCDLATTHLMPATFTWEQLIARLLFKLRVWAERDVWQDVEREEIRYENRMVAYITIRPIQALADDGAVATA